MGNPNLLITVYFHKGIDSKQFPLLDSRQLEITLKK